MDPDLAIKIDQIDCVAKINDMKKHIRVLKYDLSRTIGGVKDAEFHSKVVAYPYGEPPKAHILDVTDSIPLPIKIRTRGFHGPLKVLVSVVGAKMP